ncbi:hypothetical protein [Bifidobacterium gallicum]|uniref:Uncharacterized protein n=1 Tax=Bifidobacterium gallicum DSM 20093 = LMG 11596 TaxID=561180 RepID=D1NSL5_9BIFI|nr:hypothetical protein [Bifidobacterium gallicum]EFA23667.1 hypothetical protein BIFGAL_02773 [Bifidobacterium gallicum DSM 20093 = LMG 11596]KFI58725.1 hypothetical protein BGLCM_1018 [Bifidobacterium gallicum DSM 20093 = LMG 11596]
MAHTTIDRQWVRQQLLTNPDVRRALNATARRLAPLVQLEAFKDDNPDYAASVRVQTGDTRPGVKAPTRMKRPYARVIIGDETASEKEYGSRRYPKKGFLRRVVSRL